MTCVAVAVFPQSSVAVNVRVTMRSCGQLPGTELSANVTCTLLSQLSVAVARVLGKLAAQSIVTFAGT